MSRDIDRLGKEIIERTVSALVDLVDTQRELLVSQRDKIALLTGEQNELLRQRDNLRAACDSYAVELKALKGAPPLAQNAPNVALIDIAPQSIKPGDVIRFALNVRDASEDYLVDSITQEYGDSHPKFRVCARNIATGQAYVRTFAHDECIVVKVVEAKGMAPDDVAQLEGRKPAPQMVNVKSLRRGDVIIRGVAPKAREVTVLYVRSHPSDPDWVEVGFFDPGHGNSTRRYATTARFMRVMIDAVRTKVGPTE